MQLSMKTKYALRALLVMALNEKKLQHSKAIAKQAEVPAKFLESILAELKNNGVVSSKRGIFGGYFLSRPASEIMIGEVVRVLDGTIAPLQCASLSEYKKCDDCNDEHACVIRRTMVKVRDAISDVLDHQSLAEMLALSPKQAKYIFW